MNVQIDQCTYHWNSNWAKLPKMEGWAHHGLVISQSGKVVTAAADEPNILILDQEGNLEKSVKIPVVENHGLALSIENGKEVLWIADVGAKYEREEGEPKVIKCNFEGEVLKVYDKISLGIDEETPFCPTTMAVDTASQMLWIADGYGAFKVYGIDLERDQITVTLDGKDGLGEFCCPHWVMVDERKEKNEIYIADRANHRIQIYSTQGEFLRGIEEGLESPSVLATYEDKLLVGELNAGLIMLDKDDKRVGDLTLGKRHLKTEGWPNRQNSQGEFLEPDDIDEGEFNSPHGMAVDIHGNIYICEWLLGGRFTKLELIKSS